LYILQRIQELLWPQAALLYANGGRPLVIAYQQDKAAGMKPGS